MLLARLAELARRHGRDIATALTRPSEGQFAGLVDASGQLQDVLELVARDWAGGSEHLDGLARRIVEIFGQGADASDSMRPRGAADVAAGAAHHRGSDRRASAATSRCAAQALELSPSTIYRKRQAWAELEGKKGAA